MTPLAQRLLRAHLREADTRMAGFFASAVCFDLSAVLPLIERTAKELRGTVSGAETPDPLMEHGGLLFTPDVWTWLECRGPDGRHMGALVNTVEDQIGFTGYGPDGRIVAIGFLELQPDGEHFTVRRDLRLGAGSKVANDVNAYFGGFVSASLLLINAPRGVERVTTQAHKGLAREVRGAGLGSLRPAHTIRLSMTPGDVGEGALAPSSGSPKSFHFCRSHLRRLPSGGTTRVRAHWRGDPALGIGDGDYRVAP